MTQKKSTNVTLSFVLKKYRMKHGWSPGELSAKVSVAESIIVALEEQHWHKLPSPTEVRDSLKRLCYVLDLKYYPIVSLYEQEYRKVSQTPQSTKRTRVSRVSVTDQTIKWILAGASVLLIAGYISSQVYAFARGPGIRLSQDQEFEYVSDPVYIVEGSVDQGSQLTLNGQSVTLESDGRFRVSLNVNSGSNQLEFRVEKGTNKTQTIQKTVYLK